jgi:hypothetical protein
MIDRAVGGKGGRAHRLIGRLREIRDVKIVAHSDADRLRTRSTCS